MSDCGTTCTRVKVIITLINNSLNAICYTWLNRILIQYKLTQLNWHSALAYSWLNLSFFDHSWLNVFEATHQRRASSEAYHHSAVMNIRHREMTVSYQHQCVTELQGSSGPPRPWFLNIMMPLACRPMLCSEHPGAFCSWRLCCMCSVYENLQGQHGHLSFYRDQQKNNHAVFLKRAHI